jgi:hypothetical protein
MKDAGKNNTAAASEEMAYCDIFPADLTQPVSDALGMEIPMMTILGRFARYQQIQTT